MRRRALFFVVYSDDIHIISENTLAQQIAETSTSCLELNLPLLTQLVTLNEDLAGDLSGIQEYVFGITEGGKAESGTGKRLRARALFVQLLMV